jgi:hypothetical protein
MKVDVEQLTELSQLQAALCELPDMEREILILRFGLSTGSRMTLQGIADKIGRCREVVRCREAKALRMLRSSELIWELEAVASKYGLNAYDEPARIPDRFPQQPSRPPPEGHVWRSHVPNRHWHHPGPYVEYES